MMIRAVDALAPVPRRTILELRCDVVHGLFPPPVAIFNQGGFVENHAAAMRAGWLERQGSQGRLWLCPECSGKAGRSA